MSYYLNDVRLELGEDIELWTTYGWEIGRFDWQGQAHLPFLNQSTPTAPFVSGQHVGVVITEGMLCRRLTNSAPEPVQSIEVRRLK